MDIPEWNNLILGMATGYTAQAIRPFLQSLVLVGFRGRLVLFVYASQSKAIRAMARAHAPGLELELVRVRNIREHAKFWRSCIKRLFALAPTEISVGLKRLLLKFQGMPQVTRHFHYDDYLRTHKNFSNVLLTDVRDVIFQDDPFAQLQRGLYLGMETETLTIATEPYDRQWILGAYGEAMLQRLGDKQITCAGVVLGDAASMHDYVHKMLHEIMRLPFGKTKNRNYDQAHHNKLFHCGELSETHVCQPLRSLIATVGCLAPGDFALSPVGKLLNVDGRAAPIVHQYDRHPALVNAFHIRIFSQAHAG